MTSNTFSVCFSDTKISAAAARDLFLIPDDCGGLACFEGIVRNHNHGKAVSHISYEAYETLARKECERIIAEVTKLWPIKKLYINHRIGTLAIGDTAVIIFAASHHRKEAFLGCQYVIDELKKRVPIWKKEFYVDGSHDWTYCQENHHH